MLWTTALTAFITIFIGCTILSLFNRVSNKSLEKPVESYLLANESLNSGAVISLLLSTSFGLNYLFFQIWLGYTVGAWGLVTQGAWWIGMMLLGKYSKTVKNCKSLHELLGNKFGFTTRIVASICSIVGILFMMGWETGIGVSSLSSIFNTQNGYSANQSESYANLLIIFIVVGSLLYTIVGGLKGNANADFLLNSFKTITVTLLSIILIEKFWQNYPSIRYQSFFPSFETMRNNLGLWGLITSVTFSLIWQFVDNSTWQTIIAGNEKDNKRDNFDKKEASQAKSNLFWSGVAAFIAPGIIGTLLGIGLISDTKIEQANIFKEILSMSPALGGITLFCVFAMIISCVMSLIDGLFLTSAYTLIIDIFHPHERLSEIDSSESSSEKTLILIRASLIIIAIIALWGVRFIYGALGLTLFDCFYVMMITQLALLGPVLLVLLSNRIPRGPIWVSIIITVIFGFGLVWIGKGSSNAGWLVEGAGSFTMIFSCVISYLFSKKSSMLNSI